MALTQEIIKKMANRPISSKDIKRVTLPSRNILNTTLVTRVEVIENGKLRYFNWGSNSKVYAMMEDTQRVLRIIVNDKNKSY